MIINRWPEDIVALEVLVSEITQREPADLAPMAGYFCERVWDPELHFLIIYKAGILPAPEGAKPLYFTTPPAGALQTFLQHHWHVVVRHLPCLGVLESRRVFVHVMSDELVQALTSVRGPRPLGDRRFGGVTRFREDEDRPALIRSDDVCIVLSDRPPEGERWRSDEALTYLYGRALVHELMHAADPGLEEEVERRTALIEEPLLEAIFPGDEHGPRSKREAIATGLSRDLSEPRACRGRGW